MWTSEGSEVQFEDLPKNSNTCTEFIQTIWILKNVDMGLLRADILARYTLVSVSFYAWNVTKPAFVLSLDCFLFGCFGFFLLLERPKWSQKRHSESQIYTEVKCSGDFI